MTLQRRADRQMALDPADLDQHALDAGDPAKNEVAGATAIDICQSGGLDRSVIMIALRQDYMAKVYGSIG